MSENQKKRLNKIGRKILRERLIDLEHDDDDVHSLLKTLKYAGYAHYYLQECWNQSEMVNRADKYRYRQLVDIDSKLGTDAAHQLYGCLDNTTRWDLIKV